MIEGDSIRHEKFLKPWSYTEFYAANGSLMLGFKGLVFLFIWQGKPTRMPGNFGQKLRHYLKLPRIHAGLYC